MKNSRKALLLSAFCVAAAVLLLGYSAYGWMTMSRQVRAVGQNVSVSVPENLLISLSGTDGWSDTVNVDLRDIVETLTAGDTEKYTKGGGKSFYLLPASSYSGVKDTVWKTESALYNGAAPVDTVFQPGNRIMWSQSTGAFEGHWIDVPLYFKTDSEAAVNVALVKTLSTVTPDTNDINKAVRAAFLNPALDKNSAGGDAPFVFADSSSTGVHEGMVVNGASSKIAPIYMSFGADGLSSDNLFTVQPNTVTQITVRIWVEGQDKSCIAKIGGQSFNLNLGFGIKE